MATNEETLALVEGLARIAREYKLDALAVGDVKIARSQHEFASSPRPTGSPTDDELFHSAED